MIHIAFNDIPNAAKSTVSILHTQTLDHAAVELLQTHSTDFARTAPSLLQDSVTRRFARVEEEDI